MPEEGVSGLTEECFQKTPLRFATDQSRIQYGWDTNEAVTFQAHRTSVGTFPAGSEWTKNPIPLCNETAYGWLDPACPNGFEFPPPGPAGEGLQGDRLYGTGEHLQPDGEVVADNMWTLMDEVEVPTDLVPGDYVLSFRWDCEATPQIWNSCANIKIVQ